MTETDGKSKNESKDLLIVGALAIGGALGGGCLGGLAIYRFGSFGAVSIWALGWILGVLASKLVKPDRTYGWALATATVVGFFIAEICWIRWRIVGADTWLLALQKLPIFLQEYQRDTFIGGLMTFFGASAAFRQAGFEYEYVRVLKR